MSNAAATERSRADLPSFGSVNTIDAGVLAVGYAEAGPADGPAVILLHGWPRILREARMQSLGSGDPARRRTDYYPTWLDNLADDVTVEGAAMDGVVQGAEDVRSILVYARTLYDYREFNFVAHRATTVSSRTTPLRSPASPSALSSWLPATPAGRPSRSW